MNAFGEWLEREYPDGMGSGSGGVYTQDDMEEAYKAGQPKTWLYGLTADEWMHLASEGTESEVTPCCGDIGTIRELLQALSTCQESYGAWMRVSLGGQLLELLGEDGSGGHELNHEKSFPLLARVVAGIRAEEAQVHAENQAMRAGVTATNQAEPG